MPAFFIVALALSTAHSRTDAFSTKNLTGLLDLYRKFELPLPPSDAKLIYATDRFQAAEHGGYLVYADSKLQVRTREGWKLLGSRYQVNQVPEDEASGELPLAQQDYWILDNDNGIPTAMGAVARGKLGLARRLLSRAELQPWIPEGFNGIGIRGTFPDRAKNTAEGLISQLAFVRCIEDLTQHTAPWTAIAKRMRIVLDADRFVKDGFMPQRRAILTSLEASLAPSKALPGTVERAIDDLRETPNLRPFNVSMNDEALENLLKFGRSAVPAALEHLQDGRLASSFIQTGESSSRLTTVGDLITRYFMLVSGGRLKMQPPWSKEDLLPWWNSVKDLPERDYLVKSSLNGFGANAWIVRRLREKYPKDLAKLVPGKLWIEERDGLNVIDEIGRADLPVSVKDAALMKYVGEGKPKLRMRAILAMEGYASLTKQVQVRKVLRESSLSPSENPELPFLMGILKVSGDAVAWQEAGTRLATVPAKDRVYLLNMLFWPDDRSTAFYTELLLRFVDDASSTGAFLGVTPLPESAKGTVGTEAVWLLAALQHLEPEPGLRTDADWRAFREKVLAKAREIGKR